MMRTSACTTRFEPSGSNSFPATRAAACPAAAIAGRRFRPGTACRHAPARTCRRGPCGRRRCGAGRRAEELDLQQGVRNGGDVNGDQRLVGAAGGAVDRMRQQLLARAGLAEQQHRRVQRRRAARQALDLQAGRTVADEAGKVVLGAARLRLRQRLARGDQLGLQARIMAEERRQRLELVEQREAHRPDHIAPQVADRQARDHQRVALRLHDVEQDGLAGRDDLAQQAVGDDFLAVPADGILRVGETEARRVVLVHPDDARVTVDHHRAFARPVQHVEQRPHGKRPHGFVVGQQLIAGAGLHAGFHFGTHRAVRHRCLPVSLYRDDQSHY